jgi:uncharacterized cupin superfamily protein
VGEAGAHQLKNNSDEPVRILAISTVQDLDTVIYPDSGKTGAHFRRGKPDEYRGLFKHGTEVDYWDGENPPS